MLECCEENCMDDFKDNDEVVPRAEWYTWRVEQEKEMKGLRDLMNGHFRCVAKGSSYRMSGWLSA